MGILSTSNDLALKLNGKNGAEARLHGAAVAQALAPALDALVDHAAYQSRVLGEILEQLKANAPQ